MVENRAGEVVDHQHLPLQRVLDQEGHAVQPLTLLEHTRTHAHTHQDTYAHRTQAGKRVARRRKHVHMRTCKDMEHAGKRHTLLNGFDHQVHAGKESNVLMHPPVTATSVSEN